MSLFNKPEIASLVAEFRDELGNIADWWVKNTIDEKNGGFYGQVEADGTAVASADKGVVMHARILWFFSEVCQYIDKPEYKAAAHRAFQYITNYFHDAEYGGVYWSLTADGHVKDSKKQTYAQSFAIYGLCAYYKLTGNQQAIDKAYEYFQILQKYCHDDEKGGYLEAFDRKWGDIGDFRLSEKDDNLPKTQNTHLHVMEAYATLHLVKPTAESALALRRLVDFFDGTIINKANNHLRLFMDVDWQDHSKTFSYGHDIECSWLLYEALVALNDPLVMNRVKPLVLAVAKTTLTEGLGDQGQVCDEYDIGKAIKHQESCWWVQAEAMVGFLYTYQLTGDTAYWQVFNNIWSFTKEFHIDRALGEWHWLATRDQDADYNTYKAGFWKAPYHNGRAMMEVIKVLSDKLH
ncbi:AGE family epimerase/isomerase [Catenovulum sediminis]|uniref:AGE family epimerase/isomerase n=1 Tax=Catenovulum sediminis TaxID=1740262 RepID=UPI00117D077F|nr:AGE family epimerase/isomerase [Catenovulum sediminis]